PRRAPRAHAVVRRPAPLDTPPSAPADGGIGHGRRSPAARLRPREPTRRGRWTVVRPPATARWLPRTVPPPPAGSTAGSPLAIRPRAPGTAPRADAGARVPRSAQ